MQQIQLEWNAFEHEHIKKTSDWFWALGIIAIGGAATSIIFSNLLFAGVILIGAFVLGMHAAKRPKMVHFKVSSRGVVIDNIMHPYASLESFWVEDSEEDVKPKLLVKSKKLLAPHIVIPIENISPDDVRDHLLEYLEEEEDS